MKHSLNTTNPLWKCFKIEQVIFITTLFCLGSCHIAPEPELKPENKCSVTLLGDKDGFGMGLKEGQAWSIPAGTPLPADFIKTNDPVFTDIYPPYTSQYKASHQSFSFDVKFEWNANTPASAQLRMFTLGIQDGDKQVYGSDTDIKLFMDNQEIPKAFDDVDQFDFINGAWADIAGYVVIEIPENLLYLLADGIVTFRFEVHQLYPGSESFDAFAIDYIELIVCSSEGLKL